MTRYSWQDTETVTVHSRCFLQHLLKKEKVSAERARGHPCPLVQASLLTLSLLDRSVLPTRLLGTLSTAVLTVNPGKCLSSIPSQYKQVLLHHRLWGCECCSHNGAVSRRCGWCLHLLDWLSVPVHFTEFWVHNGDQGSQAAASGLPDVQGRCGTRSHPGGSASSAPDLPSLSRMILRDPRKLGSPKRARRNKRACSSDTALPFLERPAGALVASHPESLESLPTKHAPAVGTSVVNPSLDTVFNLQSYREASLGSKLGRPRVWCKPRWI